MELSGKESLLLLQTYFQDMVDFLNFLNCSHRYNGVNVVANCILEGRNINKHLFVLDCFCYQKKSMLFIYLVFVINLTGSEEIIDVYELRFNISKLLVDGARVTLAELRVYQTPKKQHSKWCPYSGL